MLEICWQRCLPLCIVAAILLLKMNKLDRDKRRLEICQYIATDENNDVIFSYLHYEASSAAYVVCHCCVIRVFIASRYLYQLIAKFQVCKMSLVWLSSSYSYIEWHTIRTMTVSLSMECIRAIHTNQIQNLPLLLILLLFFSIYRRERLFATCHVEV